MERKNRLKNHAKVSFDARSMNEGFARMVVMGFMMDMNPTMDELQDVKTAVSEAVTNAIIHGYGVSDDFVCGETESSQEDEKTNHQVEMTCIQEGQKLTVIIKDQGVGINDVEEARQPFFTTMPEKERSGMGFAFMETFMDEVEVCSKVGVGTQVTMTKYIKAEGKEEECEQ
ncbi:MAG: anti-sigma F factor [Agathobacter sp.]|nr:anti-sigma F factor [Agathobacter sp.]